jgi:hypothetical protein
MSYTPLKKSKRKKECVVLKNENEKTTVVMHIGINRFQCAKIHSALAFFSERREVVSISNMTTINYRV